MSLVRNLLGLIFVVAAGIAYAGDTPVIVKTETPPASNSTLNLQTSQGSSCAAPSVGACGSCSISCPTGKAAFCKAGTAVGAASDASCLQPPECKCQ